MIEPRHIQDYNDAASLEPHWGYADRVVPCTNDAGSCEYLDVVYHSHDLGMLYSGILWSVIIGGLLVWGIWNRSHSSSRLTKTITSSIRRRFLPDTKSKFGRYFFGRTTKLQILLLVCITIYLTIFSFIGIRYKTWITPVKKMPGVYNRRSSIGPLADRVGILAYALTPLSILLGSRESLLSVVTGLPYQNFNFLHRWLGHIILLQSLLHTILWLVVELRFYQPQPKVAKEWIVQPYIIWGVVAMILLLILWVLSTSWSRKKCGYEFFRKAHYLLAILYIVACWLHWKQLQCFMLPSLLLWILDRSIRLIRTWLIHYKVLPNGKGGLFEPIQAKLTYHDSDILRLDFDNPNTTTYEIGQHFYICFLKGSIWQSHPFTPLNLPNDSHGYLIRAKKGETKKIMDFNSDLTTPIILTGPYGVDIMKDLEIEDNVLCIAGGTGITFVLPILLHLSKFGLTKGRLIELVWVIRHEKDTEWIKSELEQLRKDENISITIKITRELKVSNSNNNSTISGSSTPMPISKNFDTLQMSGNQKEEIKEKLQNGDIVPISSYSNINNNNNITGEDSGCPCKPPVYTAGSSSSSSSEYKENNQIYDAEKAIEQGVEPHHRPDLRLSVKEFVQKTINGPTCVYVSGPGGMVSDVRDEVALCNDAKKVWNGEEKAEVRLIYDDRLE
ncbi:uncharacterized protein L201_001993 [Kwoniella dendrophila CBS 6074]|uniref:ferric-chelate reductase (NADPH) n=1 Tax=Kwoniella dendrophila CBS 6074 TaxID=1295534 RepID=A0AAX4JP17_9TREE